MPRIDEMDAWEVLDSRGRPTLAANLTLSSGHQGTVSIPAGKSTGVREAVELRDGGDRYGGLGCRSAARNVRERLGAQLAGLQFESQRELDSALADLDGTPDRHNLGANALLAVSLAFARAAASAREQPLFEYFAHVTGTEPRMPRLSVNLFSGGKHAFGQVAVQDVLVVPPPNMRIDAALEELYAIYQAAAAMVAERYSARALTADEGGLAPPFPDSNTMFSDALEATARAGFPRATGTALAVDVAASHFHSTEGYLLDGETLTPPKMVERIQNWVDDFGLISVEDGLAEEDWEHWPQLRASLSGRALTLADDLTCTSAELIARAADLGAADAVLIKLNQNGTLSGAADAVRAAAQRGWKVSISARSGETEDDWLADLAVGWSGDFIKVGSVTQSDRLAKYNRLLEIERITKGSLLQV